MYKDYVLATSRALKYTIMNEVHNNNNDNDDIFKVDDVESKVVAQSSEQRGSCSERWTK